MKCDETKPTCGRCVKIRFAGCMYRDEFERTWRHLTTETTEKAQEERRRRPALKTDEPNASISIQHEVRGTDVPPPSRPSIPEAEVMDGFFLHWVVSNEVVDGVAYSWMAFLPSMYRSSSPTSILAQAVSALAYASFGQRYGCLNSIVQAVKSSTAAIHMLNNAFKTRPNLNPTNEIMTSVILLGKYEVRISLTYLVFSLADVAL